MKTWALKAILFLFIFLGYILLKDSFVTQIDFFNRDLLQNLNSPSEVDQRLVTLNIDLKPDGANYPHRAEEIKTIVDKLKTFQAKHIILMMEHLDFEQSIFEKQKLYKVLSENKIYLNQNEARDDKNLFQNEEVFKEYPYFITFYRTRDSEKRENRRALLQIDAQPPNELFGQLTQMGLNPKPIEYYEYRFEYQRSQQAYVKNFPLGTYGNYHSTDLISGKIEGSVFKDRVVIIGTNDHLSFMNSKSIFYLGKTKLSPDYSKTLVPLQDVFANIINFHISGNYIKFIKNFNDLLTVCIILCVLVMLNFDIRKKLFVFYSLIPAIYLLMLTIYVAGDFYIDWSRSITLLALLQYIGTPIIFFAYFKKQEQQKLLAVNDARIDALLTVSEKVAHDIRSPISTVNLLLSKAMFENEEYRLLINSSIERINKIIESILSNYKTTGFNIANLETVDLNLIISSILSEKKVLAPDTHFINNVESSKAVVIASAAELERVISNIVDNSIQAFLNDKSNLTVQFDVNASGAFTDLIISDNGSGIPENVLNLIGQQRISTKKQGDGNGIGLLHAKRVINQFGGSLKINSSQKGTSIIISLKTSDKA